MFLGLLSASRGERAPKERGKALRTITVALAGNPNSGKTTIFNCLTGSRQHVGNYGGVTVETKEGEVVHGGYRIRVIDLPGTYSLTAYSVEEVVARDFIIRQRPDVVINIVDGSCLERHLYLTAQLREMGASLVVALNMADELKKKGMHVDMEALSRDLGAPVVPTVGTRSKGIKQLLDRVVEVGQGQWQAKAGATLGYGEEIEKELATLSYLIGQHRPTEDATSAPALCDAVSPRWVALKLLENDSEVLMRVHARAGHADVQKQVRLSQERLQGLFGEDPEALIAERRYGYVHGLCRQVVLSSAAARIELSDRIDKVLTNRVVGLPIFAILMYLTFWIVFRLGAAPTGVLEDGLASLAAGLEQAWPEGRGLLLRSLLVDGVLGGVGNVVVFLPNIVLLFAAITLLEDTGYMARAAFLMDRVMKWMGLHGKSFIPLLTGFGCTVPAIMGTRILENRADRLTTIMVLPLMSCSARFVIYAMLIPAFFAREARAAVMYLIYVIGILLAMGAARVLRWTVFKGEAAPFVLELPPYRMPTLRAVAMHVWQRSWMYLRKAGTLILAISMAMWFLTSFPQIERQTDGPEALQGSEQLAQSWAGRIGRQMEPLLKPLGFDWKVGTALIGAFAAKELFVAQMGIVYSVEQGQTETPDGPDDANGATLAQQEADQARLRPLQEHLRANYSPLVGFCMLVFCLIATPCMATLAITRKETGSWWWAAGQFAALTVLAYVVTLVVYQVGSLAGIGVG